MLTPVPLVHVGTTHTAYNVVAAVNVPLLVYVADVAVELVDHPRNTDAVDPEPLVNCVVELYTGNEQLSPWVHVIVASFELTDVSPPILPDPPFLFNVIVYVFLAQVLPERSDVLYVAVFEPPPIEYPVAQVQYAAGDVADDIDAVHAPHDSPLIHVPDALVPPPVL